MAYGKNKQKAAQREPNPPALIVWYVVERGEKKFWTRIGACWEHEDDEGFSQHLALNQAGDGRIVLRAPQQDDEEAA